MNRIFGMCFNKKVLVGLGAVGVIFALVSPGAALRALPFLLMAACPLSMLLMGSMGGTKADPHTPTNPALEPNRDAEIAALRSRLEVLEGQGQSAA